MAAMRTALAATLTFVALCLTACAHPPDEARIRGAIEAMRHAIEERRPGDFLDHVSADFTGNDGSVDREGLHNLLRVAVLRNEDVSVAVPSIDVELAGDRATVRVVAIVTGGSGGLLPERGEVYTIVSGWKRERGTWRCYNAKWSSTDRPMP